MELVLLEEILSVVFLAFFVDYEVIVPKIFRCHGHEVKGNIVPGCNADQGVLLKGIEIEIFCELIRGECHIHVAVFQPSQNIRIVSLLEDDVDTGVLLLEVVEDPDEPV